MKKILALLLLCTLIINAQQRKVLVEMFTNSHCSVCPPAHAALNNYINSSPNTANINFIFYHMVYPYSDDPLYQSNTEDPAGRNNYYGPFSATPVIFFDGVNQGRTYNEFSSRLDERVSVVSPLEINLSGTKTEGIINVEAQIIGAAKIPQSDLVIHFVVTENVTYTGRNSVSPQDFVMRKMVTSSTGEAFSVEQGENKTISKNIPLSQNWIPDSLSVIVFIQSTGTKEVFQSAMITYEELEITTEVDEKPLSPSAFKLYQNYPNPFNPKTRIQYEIGFRQYVSLKIYDLLGNEITTLISGEKEPGTYNINFEASHLPSGIYYYTLRTGDYTESRKMVLMK